MSPLSKTTNNEPAIFVENLSVRYGEHAVVDSVSFSIESGKIAAIVGPNGSGKTTLMKAILGLVPSRGEIIVLGQHLHDVRSRVGYVPQRFTFDRDFPITVEEFLNLARSSKCASSRITTVVKEVGLTPLILHKHLGNLSGGQLQRILIAQAILHDPAILFLDEPAERVQDIRIGASAALQDKQKIAYAKLGEKAQEVWIFNADGTETMVARMPSISIAPKIEWSADGSFLSIQTPLRNGVSTWLIDATNGASIELPFSFQKDGWWDATADNRYYITTASGVSLFDLTRRTATPLPKGTVAATSDNDQFLLLQSTPQGLALAHHSILDPLGTRILAHLPFGSYRFLPAPSGIILLEEIGRHGLVLLTRFGDEARAGLHTTAVLWQWEPNGQRLLYSDGFDLHLYRPDRDEDTTITRQSRRITSLAWHPEGSAIIFMQEDGLYGMELDTRDILNTVKLETGDGFESLLVDNDGKNAYFIGTVNGVSGLFRRVLQK